jgi:DNA-binding CsgD family transcriptional regulator
MYADMHRTPGAAEIVGIHADALRGDDDAAQSAGAAVIAVAQATGLGVIGAAAHDALVILEISRGRYAAALQHALALFDHFPISVSTTVLPDMVEAALRSGDRATAERAMHRLAHRATASGSAWAMGLLARTRALMDGPDGEPSFREAITLLSSTPLVLETARTHLLYGELLRRAGRRLDARVELRTAHEMFSAMGATVFADRAADELLASGERTRKRIVSTANELTPREARVARLAADGGTNAEIAAQLFLSAHTVEYHLRKVYRKLDVASRRQLKLVLPADGAAVDR